MRRVYLASIDNYTFSLNQLSAVIAHFKSVESLLNESWSGGGSWAGSFLLDQASTLFNDFARIVSRVRTIRRITRTFNSQLAAWSLFLKFAFTLKRYLGYLKHSGATVAAITDENYRRREIMSRASEKASAQDQVSILTYGSP
jgi:hypothetical protein